MPLIEEQIYHYINERQQRGIDTTYKRLMGEFDVSREDFGYAVGNLESRNCIKIYSDAMHTTKVKVSGELTHAPRYLDKVICWKCGSINCTTHGG